MPTFYEILGVDHSASVSEIRNRYKKLAMQYHPDRNLENPNAGEQFKKISEAYETLSDPESRKVYDYKLLYVLNQLDNHVKQQKQEEEERERFYEEFYKKKEQKQEEHRKLEKKATMVAVLGILGLVGGWLILLAIINYVDRVKAENKVRERTEFLDYLKDLTFRQEYDSVLLISDKFLKSTNDFEVSNIQDSILTIMEHDANTLVENEQYDEALSIYTLLGKFSLKKQFGLDFYINFSLCFKKKGDFQAAINILEEFHNKGRSYYSISFEIAELYKEKLNNKEKAFDYYIKSIYLAEKFYISNYGEAYYAVISSENAPKGHYELYCRTAESALELKKMSIADNCVGWAMRIRPNKARAYFIYGHFLIEKGDVKEACNSWKKSRMLGMEEANEFIKKYCN